MKNNKRTANTQSFLPRFGSAFLDDHARLIISDSKIALIELVANCWDAGADKVEITWPDPAPDILKIEDNGTGMTYREFLERWLELNYNRKEVQGEDVVFPPSNQTSHRKAFGRNGKGRHSMFCFASEYLVETWRDGESNQFRVKRSQGISNTPFEIIPERRGVQKDGHGTIISAELARNHLPTNDVRDLIGSKFISDPAFRISVNGEVVKLTDLDHLVNVEEVQIPGLGKVLIRTIDSRTTGRTSKQHGVAWWVNKRLVGELSWKGFDDDAYLDARTSEAKQFTFVVEADLLADEVTADWSAFKESENFNKVSAIVKTFVVRKIRELLQDVNKSRKLAALEQSVDDLRALPLESRYRVGQFINAIQEKIPTFGQKELAAVVEIASKLEKSRSGYALLEQLAKLQPHDLEALNQILDTWTIGEIRIVLSELEWRLELIKRMETLVENPTSDELHDIQPLFERGLWIFGPEYEAISFMSNKTLLTIIERFFKDKIVTPLSTPRKRPDIVALPDSTLSIYASDSYDERSEVSGFAKVLIVELKKGGFKITRGEKRQAQDYASEIRKSGKVQHTTEITAFVLGTNIDNEALEDVKEGQTTVIARPYSTVLRQAHARTFNLIDKIKKAKIDDLYDSDVEKVVKEAKQLTLQPQPRS